MARTKKHAAYDADRIMKELMNDGKIKRVGSTRTGHWEIND